MKRITEVKCEESKCKTLKAKKTFSIIQNEKRFTFYVLLLTIFICFSFDSFAEEKQDPFTRFLTNFNSMQAGFTQILINESGEELERSTGVFYLQQPEKFHWSYQQPYIQKIITNGKLLWIIDEDIEQVTIREVSEAISHSPISLILGPNSIEDYFTQADMGIIEGFEWIQLTPKAKEAQYKTIRVGFDRDKLGMMIIADSLGQTTRIDFNNVEKNVELSSSLFNVDITDNFDVIDERLSVGTE